MSFQKITEQESLYSDLDRMSVRELLEGINQEDRKVAAAVGAEIPKIERLVTLLVERMRQGGRLFYIGAGTSGRLAVEPRVTAPSLCGVNCTRTAFSCFWKSNSASVSTPLVSRV